MSAFNVSDISQYRTHLMGVATLLVLFGHSAGNGVVMPGWMESLCGLASVGVDIFLFVSGLGLWYSLRSVQITRRGGVIPWYKRRYKRILVPYLLICGFSSILAVTRGDKALLTAVLDLSTINYWLNHQGAWYVAMLFPLYAITPLHDLVCSKIQKTVTYNLVLVTVVVGLSCVHIETQSVVLSDFMDNVRHVVVHLPAFFLGFMLAPMAKGGKTLGWHWLFVSPVLIVIVMKLTGIGYWPGFLFLPVVGLLCLTFHCGGRAYLGTAEFFGRISLESYLFNGAVGSWVIAYFSAVYHSSLNQGCYLHYALVCVIGTVLSYMVHRLCQRLFFRKT